MTSCVSARLALIAITLLFEAGEARPSPPGVTLRGAVVTTDGKPAPHFSVTVTAASASPQLRRLSRLSEDAFSIALPREGDYVVEISAERFFPVRTTVK